MSLSHHVDPEELICAAEEHPHHKHVTRGRSRVNHSTRYSGRYQTQELPKFRVPDQGIDAQVAYQIVHDELELDGQPLLNLASFVHTWMPDEATRLIMENISKNLIDSDEYPATTLIHTRLISMLASLWHAPKSSKAIGTATTGSSEAIQLGGLAMKKRWQAKMKSKGKNIHEPGPNIVFGSNAQVALEKFARYWDVEARLVPVSEDSRYVMDPKRAMEYVDENTIGFFVILGSTYTGHFENVKELSDLLDEYEKKTGIDLPIHVDGASGGFVAPFAYPDLEWDFRLPRVVSINTSGHKYGRAYVGVGFVIWKDESLLPKELIFELHYLGSTEYSFSLNFSRPAAPIIGQYFNLIQLGKEGFKNIAFDDLKNARLLSRALERSGYYTVLSEVHHPTEAAQTVGGKLLSKGKEAAGIPEDDPRHYKAGLPVVSFRFSDEFKKENPHIKQAWIQTLLRVKGWIVPNYGLPPILENIEILRVVVRESVSEDMIDRLVADILEVTESLLKQDGEAVMLAATSSGAKPGKDNEHARNGERKLTRSCKKEGVQKSVTYAKQC